MEYNVSRRQRSDSNRSLDKYKHEIDELHKENEEFKQLLDSLDNKDGGKGDNDDGRNNAGSLSRFVLVFRGCLYIRAGCPVEGVSPLSEINCPFRGERSELNTHIHQSADVLPKINLLLSYPVLSSSKRLISVKL